MKRKATINFSLMDALAARPFGAPAPSILVPKPENTFSCIEISPCHVPSRVCTPSPPMSPEQTRPMMALSPLKSRKKTFFKKHTASKSILRKSTRSKLAHYRNCRELVDPIRDLSIATDYELLLFSNMIMGDDNDASFQCKRCNGCVKFCCKTVTDFEATTPQVEQHLRECCGPSFSNQILDAKALHRFQSCPRKPYARLVWKRILARAIFSRVEHAANKRVNFSKTLRHERIIPSRHEQRALM